MALNTKMLSHLMAAKMHRPIGLSLLAGVLGSFNFAPYSFWLCGILSLWILFWVIWRSEFRSGMTALFCYWTVFFICGMFWAHLGLARLARVPAEVGMALAFGSALIYAVFLCIPWALCFLFRRQTASRLMVLPFIWIVGELSREWILGGLTWQILGYGHQASWLAGWIPIFGVLGGSFFVALTAAILLLATIGKSKKSKGTALIAIASIALIWCTGGYLQRVIWTEGIDLALPVTLIQPYKNVALDSVAFDRVAFDSVAGEDALVLDEAVAPEQPLTLGEQGRRWSQSLETQSQPFWQPGLLVWPEGSLRIAANEQGQYLQDLSLRADKAGVALVAGGWNYPNPGDGQYMYNSVYGAGLASGVYSKVHLAPLGESVLFNRLFFRESSVRILAPKSSEQPLLELNYHDHRLFVATSICYEIAFGSYIRAAAEQANLLLNVSSDSWFDGSAQLDQSLQIAQIRALEHQKPMLRATDTGISAVIDFRGNLISSIAKAERAVLHAKVQPRTGATPYSRWGDLPILLLGLVVGLIPLLVESGSAVRSAAVEGTRPEK